MRRKFISCATCSIVYFNPRTREGCDTTGAAFSAFAASISIHAPVKGATTIGIIHIYAIADFNPRTREGCDNVLLIVIKHLFVISIHAPVKGATVNDFHHLLFVLLISIHAPVKGATHGFPCCKFVDTNFNPRTREGCDTKEINRALKDLSISIHAPVKGATKMEDYIYRMMDISIHAPVKGATIVTVGDSPAQGHFNPRTREGCDTDFFIAG